MTALGGGFDANRPALLLHVLVDGGSSLGDREGKVVGEWRNRLQDPGRCARQASAGQTGLASFAENRRVSSADGP